MNYLSQTQFTTPYLRVLGVERFSLSSGTQARVAVAHGGGQLPMVPIYLDGLVRAMTRTYEDLLEHLPGALQNQVRNAG